MITIEPYEEEHIWDGVPWKETLDVDQINQALLVAQVADTVFWDNEVIAIISMTQYNLRTAMVNTIVNKGIHKCPKEFSELVKRQLDFHMDRLRVRKTYAIVDSDIKVNIRWIERLGFREEYRMIKAGNHLQDIIGYAYIR